MVCHSLKAVSPSVPMPPALRSPSYMLPNNLVETSTPLFGLLWLYFECNAAALPYCAFMRKITLPSFSLFILYFFWCQGINFRWLCWMQFAWMITLVSCCEGVAPVRSFSCSFCLVLGLWASRTEVLWWSVAAVQWAEPRSFLIWKINVRHNTWVQRDCVAFSELDGKNQ